MPLLFFTWHKSPILLSNDIRFRPCILYPLPVDITRLAKVKLEIVTTFFQKIQLKYENISSTVL